MKKKSLLAAAVLAALMVPQVAGAEGFGIVQWSAEGVAMGGARMFAENDVSMIAANPASLTKFQGKGIGINACIEYSASSCTRPVSKYLYEETCSELKQFSKNGQFALCKNHEQRIEWFNSHLNQKPDFFCNIGYATLKGDAIAANNVLIDVSDRPYFTDIVSGKKIESVHGPYVCRATGETVIVVSQGVYDAGGILQGVMFCSVKLSTLAMLTEKLDIKNDGRFFIIGDDGKFICHYDTRYLGQSYTPSNEKYRKLG